MSNAVTISDSIYYQARLTTVTNGIDFGDSPFQALAELSVWC